MNKKRIVLLVIISVMVICCVTYVVLSLMPPKEPPPWYVLTSPLEQSVVDDLCGKLDLTAKEREKLCIGQAVYPDQFLDAFKRTFPAGSSYEAVQEKFMGYQSRLVRSDDGKYMYTYYDFRGDGVIEIAFDYKNHKLISLGSTQNYDDWYPGRLKQLTEEAQQR